LAGESVDEVDIVDEVDLLLADFAFLLNVTRRKFLFLLLSSFIIHHSSFWLSGSLKWPQPAVFRLHGRRAFFPSPVHGAFPASEPGVSTVL